MINLGAMMQPVGQMFGFGGEEDGEEDVRQGRMRRYREYMQRAPSFSVPSSTAGVQAQMAGLHHAGGAHLQAAANNVMQAHATEMQSRVSQQREMRRMQHEKDLMRMRAEADIYGAAIRSLLG